jgi:chromosome segregation ATPase
MSPTCKRPAREEQLLKQVQSWEERAVVWDRERKVFERRLEKALTQTPRDEEDSQVKYLKALHKRQQCKIEELERQIKRLELDQGTQSTESDSPGYRLRTGLKEVKIVHVQGRLVSEDEAERIRLQSDYTALLEQHETALKDLRDTKHRWKEALDEAKELRSTLSYKDTEIRTLILKYDQLTNRKEAVSEATLKASLQSLDQATALQDTISNLQLKHAQAVAGMEQQLAAKRETALELTAKSAKAEHEASQVRTQLRDLESNYLVQSVNLSEMRALNSSLQLELSRAIEEGATLQSALSEAQVTIHHFAGKLTSSQEQITQLNNQRDSLKTQSATDQKTLSTLRSQLEASKYELSVLQRAHSELKLVLGLEQQMTLSPAELRGLAYILLSEDKSAALGLLFGREYEGVTKDYEREIASLRQELVKEKARHEDEIERLIQTIEKNQGILADYERATGRKGTIHTFEQSDLLVRDMLELCGLTGCCS